MTKRLISVLLVLSFVFLALGAADPQGETSEDKSDTLKILCIGNSFNQDTMAYFPPVMREILPGTRIACGVLESSGATLANHLEWLGDGTDYSMFDLWMPKENAWKRFTGSKAKSLSEVLALTEWDIITIQGVSRDVLSDEEMEKMTADAQQLIEQLRAQAKKPFALMWFEWIGRPEGNYTSDQMAEKIRTASLYVQSKLDIDAVIPVGDAFQAARADERLRSIGSSPDGNLMYIDNVHMQAGLPSLLAAYTTAAAVLRYYGMDSSALEYSMWTPSLENAMKINATNAEGSTFTHGFPDGVTAANIALAKQIAIDSVNNFGA